MSARNVRTAEEPIDVFGLPEQVQAVVPARSKLHPPRTRRAHVSRADLIARLEESDVEAIIVTAAAGYGKSMLLAELAATDERPIAWLTVDEADNDPTVLLGGIAFALDAIEPIEWDRFAELLRGPLSIISSALRGFGWVLAERTTPFLLILDDVHELVSHEAIDVLDALIASLPDGCAVALGGRDGSRLHRGALRAHRHIIEVGADDLAFDTGQVTLLASELGVELEPDEIDQLTTSTEGWPLAVYLSLRSRDERTIRHQPAALAGDTRLMAEFFSEVLLEGLDPTVAAFLMAVSTFERFSGPMCDEVLERTGSAALLDDLERQNLLVVPLDDRREWYRLHHLWAEFLAAELERRDPGAGARLAMGASRWYEAHGEVNSAITSAAKARDLDGVERLIVANFPLYSTTFRLATIDRWLGLLGRADLMARPQLMVLAGFSKFANGEAVPAAEWLALATSAVTSDDPDVDGGWTPPVALALLRAMVACQPAVDMARDARLTYEHLAPGQDYRMVACLLRGAAAFMVGDHDSAERMFREGAFGAEERPMVKALNLAHLAIMRIEQDDWDGAADVVAELRTGSLADESTPIMCLVTAVRTLLDAHGHDTDDTLERWRRCRQQLAGFDDIAPWLNIQTRIALAHGAVLSGHPTEAATLLDEAEQITTQVPDAVAVREQLTRLRRAVTTRQPAGAHGPSSLTTAELRVLQYLPTHLSLAEIAERLYVSRNTVKSQSIAIYRKFGTSSRSGAVDIAREAQLID
ncbi:MAG: LuxR C-terminal-related transcriptional regulator [Acidimicrobiia bacterium]|nr:LuxR C-terminal-related transcriptional regulator [Acidimicrobiia bacterium]